MSKNSMHIGVTGGASAGHVIPALAVAASLKRDGARVTFYGRGSSIEHRLAVRAGLAFKSVPASGLRRFASARNLAVPFVVAAGFLKAVVELSRDRPDVLFSKGSYVSVPVALAAFLLRIPIVTHESDHSLGLATMIVGRMAKLVLLSFPATDLPRYLESKSVVVGQIVRPDLAEGNPGRMRGRLGIATDSRVLLVFGGSSGATRINSVVRSGLEQLLAKAVVVHICGPGNLETALAKTPGYFQFEFLDEEMPDALWLADVVVARAGANTVAELDALGKSAILIPLPLDSSRGDQFENAKDYARKSESVVIFDEEMKFKLIETASALLDAVKPPPRVFRPEGINAAANRAAELVMSVRR